LYPVGLEFPGHVETAHLAAGIALLLVMIAALAHGPALARIAVVFLLLALLPYVPIRYALAPRYVYMASAPFSILAALFFTELARYSRRLAPAAPAALAVLAIGVVGLYSWQTWEQNKTFEQPSDDWHALVTGLERSDAPPDGSRVYLRGAPITEPGYQFAVLPAVGEVVWGDVELFSIAEGTATVCTRAGAPTYIYDYDGTRYVQTTGIPAEGASKKVYRFPPPIPAECSHMVSLP
jgi:hypothetical protein